MFDKITFYLHTYRLEVDNLIVNTMYVHTIMLR